MSIIKYADKVRQTSTTVGIGTMALSASTGYRTFSSAMGYGSTNLFHYHIYRTDNNLEWEIGTGYITAGASDQLVRLSDGVIASTNNNNLTSFTAGTFTIEPIISQNRVNTALLNTEIKNVSFTGVPINCNYVIDASTSNIIVNLPSSENSEPVILGFLLSATSGNNNEQANAITIVPSGSETINGTGNYIVSLKNDFVQLMSVPSQSGWYTLDPIQDSVAAHGNNGYVQFVNNAAFSGEQTFFWDSNSKSLLIGGTGTVASADIVLPNSIQSAIFNQQQFAKNFRVAGTGNQYVLFVDGSSNTVGINTSSANDQLTIQALSQSGITVKASGYGPSLTLSNIQPSGDSTNDYIGKLIFNGLNSSGNSVSYVNVYGKISDPTNLSEDASFGVDIRDGGSLTNIVYLSSTGITLGTNNTNYDGTIIGFGATNEGTNVAIGNYHNICGENCVVIGDTSTVNSGTFGGTIGSNHTVSGNNIWIIGGSGLSASGAGTYIALDNSNYLVIKTSGSMEYNTLANDNTYFKIKNNLTSALSRTQNLVFQFVNTSGISKTGLQIGSLIVNPTGNNETTKLTASILIDGASTQALSVQKQEAIFGLNTVSGTNIVFGDNNIILSSGNIVYGRNISTSGTDNVLIGRNLSCSGTGITNIGSSNICTISGNLNSVLLGNNNVVDEDYAVAVGNNNTNSGLYSVSFGYDNGAHGSYSVSVGTSNVVQNANGSTAIGRNNNILGTGIDALGFALGLGNTITVDGTGVVFGSNNIVKGTNNTIIGQNCSVSGNQNVINGYSCSATGNNNVILGYNTRLSSAQSGNVLIGNNFAWGGSNSVVISGSNVHILTHGAYNISGNPINLIGSNINLLTPDAGNIVGGYNNSCSGNSSFIGGGQYNKMTAGIQSYYGFIGAGTGNTIGGDFGMTIVGGTNNTILENGINGFIGGGDDNKLDYTYSVICGGQSNIASGNYVSILGGTSNVVSGDYSSVLGGQNNNDKGYSNVFILGSNIDATQADTTYVQSLKGSSGVFTTNLCVGTSTPSGALNIVGNLNVNGIATSNSGIFNNRISIGTSTPSGSLYVIGDVNISGGNLSVYSGIKYFDRPVGVGSVLVVDNANTIRETSSSIRFKENVVSYTKGLDIVSQLNPVYYNFKNQNKQLAGFIAEDISNLGLEEFVIRDADNNVKDINYNGMITLLVNAIKELKEQIQSLKSN